MLRQLCKGRTDRLAEFSTPTGRANVLLLVDDTQLLFEVVKLLEANVVSSVVSCLDAPDPPPRSLRRASFQWRGDISQQVGR